MVIRHDPDALHAMVVAQRSLLAAATVEQVVGAMIDLVIDLGGDIASGSTVDLVAGSDEVLPIDLSFGVDSPVLAVAQPLGVTRMRLETILPGLVVEAGEVARRLRRRSPRGVDPVTGFADRWAASRVVSAAGISDALVVLRVVTDDPAAVRNVARRLRISARSGRFARFDLDGSVDLVAVVGRHMVQQVRWALGASGGGATEHLPVRWVVEPVGPGGCVPAAGHGGGVSVMAVPGLGALARCQRQLVDSSVLSAEIRGRIDAEYR